MESSSFAVYQIKLQNCYVIKKQTVAIDRVFTYFGPLQAYMEVVLLKVWGLESGHTPSDTL